MNLGSAHYQNYHYQTLVSAANCLVQFLDICARPWGMSKILSNKKQPPEAAAFVFEIVDERRIYIYIYIYIYYSFLCTGVFPSSSED